MNSLLSSTNNPFKSLLVLLVRFLQKKNELTFLCNMMTDEYVCKCLYKAFVILSVGYKMNIELCK